jgi:WD40 repeat protein
VYKGHQGPVTSIAVWDTGSWLALFTASWDKTVRIWNATVSLTAVNNGMRRLLLTSQTGELKHELKGHSDFVKSLTIIQIPGTAPYLLTTSSDRTIRLWDLSPLQTDDGGSAPISALPLKEHTRPVDCAAWRVDDSGQLAIWTADSMGIIKEWEIVGGKLKYVKDWKGHETSISCLHVAEDGLWSGKSLHVY